MKTYRILDSGTTFDIVPLIIAIIIIFLIIGVTIYSFAVKNKYKKFVSAHSVALKQIEIINSHYQFKHIPNFDMKHSYDNENFYEDISCLDYLTYQLAYSKNRVNAAMKDTLDNKYLFEKYQQEIKDTVTMDQYDTDELLKNRKRMKKYEQELFDAQLERPIVDFKINVKLSLTNINGYRRWSKSETFYPKLIKDTIFKLNQKRGDFYTNQSIWQAICRVERGRVTNKMRFSIYERDGYRCRICGRKTKNLEIDHIIPIAKGGKSVYENLQTLCHRCNVKKGDSLDY